MPLAGDKVSCTPLLEPACYDTSDDLDRGRMDFLVPYRANSIDLSEEAEDLEFPSLAFGLLASPSIPFLPS